MIKKRGKTLEQWKEKAEKDYNLGVSMAVRKYIIVLEDLVNEYKELNVEENSSEKDFIDKKK